MGAWMCKRAEPQRVLFLGLDAAGKTTLLYQMKLGEVVTTIPTIGFNVETVTVDGGLELTCWDMGGRDKIRPLYRHYMTNTASFVYVVDSTDRDRIGDAFAELRDSFLKMDEFRDKVCMILANKQDVPGAMTVADVEDAFKKHVQPDQYRSQTLFVCPVSASTGEGIHQAFTCFLEQLEERRKCPDAPRGFISVDYSQRGQAEAGVLDSTGHRLVKRLVKQPIIFLKSMLFY